jgi:hypothetical protein
MTDSLPVSSNVYYLPVNPSVTEPKVPEPRTISFRERSQRTWWRLTFMAMEICTVLRRGGRQLLRDDDVLAFDRWNDAPERRRPRYAMPAQVIDFAAARERLRGQARA